jgi:hypothetical protein
LRKELEARDEFEQEAARFRAGRRGASAILPRSSRTVEDIASDIKRPPGGSGRIR